MVETQSVRCHFVVLSDDWVARVEQMEKDQRGRREDVVFFWNSGEEKADAGSICSVVSTCLPNSGTMSDIQKVLVSHDPEARILLHCRSNSCAYVH